MKAKFNEFIFVSWCNTFIFEREKNEEENNIKAIITKIIISLSSYVLIEKKKISRNDRKWIK